MKTRQRSNKSRCISSPFSVCLCLPILPPRPVDMNGPRFRRAIPTHLIPLTENYGGLQLRPPLPLCCLKGGRLLPWSNQVDAGGNICCRLRCRRGGMSPECPRDVDILSEREHCHYRLLHLSEAVRLDETSTEANLPTLPNPLPPQKWPHIAL